MPSTFGWLDYSEHERRQSLEVIDLLREEGTQDELGIGVIRDTFSDLLFPGTSTIQTRLRYFLFVPWMMQDMERRRTRASEFPQRSRQIQDWLRKSLVQGGEELGVIGYRAKIDVRRLPSSVYWQGIQRWGILRFRGSEEDYRRGLDAQQVLRSSAIRTDDGEDVGADSRFVWDPHLPQAPKGFLTTTGFALTLEEADYLKHRLAMSAPLSLLRYLVDRSKTIDGETRFPWDFVPEDELTGKLRCELLHARCFSEVMLGASLLYNLILAEETRREDLQAEYADRLEAWWDILRSRSDVFESWDRRAFWELVKQKAGRIPARTEQFVEGWWKLVFEWRGVQPLISVGPARVLIEDRERQLKRGRARIGNPRARDLWSGESGTSQLDYRWNRPVRTLINDLLKTGLEEGQHA